MAEVSGDDVMVRCGPSEGFYATQRLHKGDRLTVVGVRGATGDWAKVVPPAGAFFYVARAYVELDGGSDPAGRALGHAKKPDLNVRAGSSLNGNKRVVMTTLNAGDPVARPWHAGRLLQDRPPAGRVPVRPAVAPVGRAGGRTGPGVPDRPGQ